MNFGPPLRPHLNHFFLGLDLGQRCDHPALVVLERTRVLTGAFDHANYVNETAPLLYLRHAERFPLHFPYLEIPNAIHSLFPRLDRTIHLPIQADKSHATGTSSSRTEPRHRRPDMIRVQL